jgi:hypothetical protein
MPNVSARCKKEKKKQKVIHLDDWEGPVEALRQEHVLELHVAVDDAPRRVLVKVNQRLGHLDTPQRHQLGLVGVLSLFGMLSVGAALSLVTGPGADAPPAYDSPLSG